MNHRIVAAALAAGALAVPTAAVAHPGHGKGHEKHAAKSHEKHSAKSHEKHGAKSHEKHAAKGHGKTKTVMFVFKGTFTAPGTVDVLSGNSHVRKGGFVGHAVTFDLAGAKVVAADTNADQQVDVTDVKDGDVVLVQARVAKRTQYADGADAVTARKLVDQTNAPIADDSPESGDDASPTS